MLSLNLTGIKLLYSLLILSCSLVVLRSSLSLLLTNKSSGQGNKLPPTTMGQQTKLLVAKKGFILSLHIWEQQTQGLLNLRQLQCLANIFGVKVVQPFVDGTFLTFRFGEMKRHKEMLRLSDLINIDVWNKELATLYDYEPLASWETFLSEAPRIVIIHCIQYPSLKGSSTKEDINFQYGCPNNCYRSFSDGLSYLSKYGFRVVKKTCSNFIDFAGNASVSVKEFGENMFGGYNPHKVTVIIDSFHGLRIMRNRSRLPLIFTKGFKRNLPPNVTLPSERIVSDAEKYIHQRFNDNKYISILARIELIIHHNQFKFCTDKLMDIVTEMVQEREIRATHSQVFLAMDVGRFGSHVENRVKLQPLGKALLNRVFMRNDLTLQQWEESFTSIASSDNPAYVANLQQTIAARGECLIMVGGGSFQMHARKLYEMIHPEPHRCVYSICD